MASVPSSINLWLDDLRPAPEGWLHVKTVDQAKYFLRRGQVRQMSLDHDLGEEETGYDLLVWLEREIAKDRWQHVRPVIFVHSANPVGRRKMFAAIQSIQRLEEVA